MSGRARRRSWAWMVGLALLAACTSEPELTLVVAADRVPAAPGTVGVRVEVEGGDPAEVELRTTFGRLTDLRVAGDAVVAEWTGLVDPDRGPVEIQAALGNARARASVRIVAGTASSVSVTAPTPWIDADAGRASLYARVVDAAGRLAEGSIQATVSAGRVENLIPLSQGLWRIDVADLRSMLDNPVVVSVGDGTSAAVTELTVSAGKPAAYEFVVPSTPVDVAAPFTIELHSVDAWGNDRPVFGEVAGLRAYRRTSPEVTVPISPVATNIFVGGRVTMEVSLHGAGPDIVIEAAAPDSGPTSISPAIQVLAVEPQCVVVNPTGLDGRIQESTSLGRAGGFPLQVVVYAQDCRDIETNGPDFRRRLAGLEPEVWAHLADGSLWGSSLGPDVAPSTTFPNGERVGDVRFRPEDLSWRFEVTGLTQVAYSPVIVTATVGDIVGQLNVEPTPGRWAGIRIEPIPDQFEGVEVPFGPITAATGFGFSAIAVDLYGNQVPTAQGTLTCRTATDNGGISPTRLQPTQSVPPVLGIVNQFFSIVDVDMSSSTRSAQYVSVRIYCQKTGDPSVTGRSNLFRVWTYDLTNFGFDGLSTDFLVRLPGQTVNTAIGADLEVAGEPTDRTAGVPFTIDIYARAQVGATIDRPLWYGNLRVDALQGDIDLADGGADGLSKRMTCTRLSGNVFSDPCNNTSLNLNDRYSRVGSQQVILYTAGTQSLIANAAVPSIPPSFRSTSALAALPTTTFTVLPGPAASFEIAAQPPTEVTAGDPFSIEIQIVDPWGNAVDNFDGELQIDDRSRSMSPRTAAIVDGRADVDLTIWTATGPNQLTFRVPALSARRTSDVFLVLDP